MRITTAIARGGRGISASHPPADRRDNRSGRADPAIAQERHQNGGIFFDPPILRVYDDRADTPQDAERVANALDDARTMFAQIDRAPRVDRLPTGAPEVPPCTAWCEAEHNAAGGWDDIEVLRGSVRSLAKTCKHSVDSVSLLYRSRCLARGDPAAVPTWTRPRSRKRRPATGCG